LRNLGRRAGHSAGPAAAGQPAGSPVGQPAGSPVGPASRPPGRAGGRPVQYLGRRVAFAMACVAVPASVDVLANSLDAVAAWFVDALFELQWKTIMKA